MKEHPIIFSTPMVREILAGRKTQTRRVISQIHGMKEYLMDGQIMSIQTILSEGYISTHIASQCPYGQPGHLLWVKETWHQHYQGDELGGRPCYKADGICHSEIIPWKSSRFMPRFASRITLEIIKVRVERLKELTFGDLHAEGLKLLDNEFIPLWNDLNEKRGYGWGTNPWVWVIEFRLIEKGS
jgi:hypothetical protein